MKTIIIASGSSVLEHEFKEKINDFDYVIRFKGYENQEDSMKEHVGSKVDGIVFNTNINTIKDMKQRLDRGEYKNVDLYMSWTAKSSLRRGLKHLKEHMGKINTINYRNVTKKVGRVGKKLDGFHTNKSYTSGIIAISHFKDIDSHLPLYVHGFDSVHKEENSFEHYYEETQENTLKRLHDLDNEALVIQEWINEGKVHTLI